MSEPSATPPQKLKSSSRSPSQPVSPASRRSAPEHDVDFQATFPGWPREYFMGILPVVSLKALYAQMGYPGYNYTELEECTLETPFPNSHFKPTTPDPMYVATMPWTAYPYGIPVREHPKPAVVEAPVMESFLAVPLPKERVKKNIAAYWQA